MWERTTTTIKQKDIESQRESTMSENDSSKKKSSKSHRSGGDVGDDEPPLENYER